MCLAKKLCLRSGMFRAPTSTTLLLLTKSDILMMNSFMQAKILYAGEQQQPPEKTYLSITLS
jgi:hypothetical protein